MTAFVILAAGPGTRMRRNDLHKALLPLEGKAIISRQIELAPAASHVIVVTGAREAQIRDYLNLAHPFRPGGITVINNPSWGKVGSGPGHSLLCARNAVGDDDMIFTSCDTLWERNEKMWTHPESWVAVADVPVDTPLDRWCRVGFYGKWYDKTMEPANASAYTGLAMIRERDLPDFWAGIEHSDPHMGELQVTGGLREVYPALYPVKWTDVGSQEAYEKAVIERSGYDWSKPGEATWVLPDNNRVVKYNKNGVTSLIHGAYRLGAAAPKITGQRYHMYAYEYVKGQTAYQAAEWDDDLLLRLLPWAERTIWKPVKARNSSELAFRFYHEKTRERIRMLPSDLQTAAWEIFNHKELPWGNVLADCEPVKFHGDFNFGNIICTESSKGWDGFRLIDWRGDFAGSWDWGDKRYDLAKLYAGLIVHWGRAQHGDFGLWEKRVTHLIKFHNWFGGSMPKDIAWIAILSLLNSAPLHAEPLQTYLVKTAYDLMGCHVPVTG